MLQHERDIQPANVGNLTIAVIAHRLFTFLMFSTSTTRLDSSLVILAVASLGIFVRN
jgi:hypothetical protein